VEPVLAIFLEGRFVILEMGAGTAAFGDQLGKQVSDQHRRPFIAAVEKDRGDYGFEGVGEERGFLPAAGGLLSFSQEQALA